MGLLRARKFLTLAARRSTRHAGRVAGGIIVTSTGDQSAQAKRVIPATIELLQKLSWAPEKWVRARGGLTCML
jgi:hypothetical protein